MTRFEYLSVLVSIVIALGMSEVLSVWGRLLRHRRTVQLHWIHASWSLFAILMMAQLWWGFWNYRVIESWTFAGLLIVLGDALLVVLAALVITPSDRVAPGLDLRAFYFENHRLFFGLAGLLILQLGFSDAFVAGQPVLHVENAVRGVGLGLVGAAAASANERLHGALVVAGFLLLAAFVTLEFNV